jgi:RNA-binding protein
LQRLGRVLHISPSGNIIAKVENTPRIGETVVDENLKIVGKIFDLFGPVNSPYVAIRPTIMKTEELTNKTLYISPQRGERRKH